MTKDDPNTNAAGAATMELLWSRIRQRGDLPGFSKVISTIVGAMRGDEAREFNMAKTVLQDPALTQKVLRLANSAMYSVFGQGINTVSKAVIVLGTETIGHLALGLKLIDGLSAASSDSAAARAEMEKAVLAGHIGRQLASSAPSRDAEEAVVCAMLHSLGRMLVTFYLPDRWQRIDALITEAKMTEDAAALEVLGILFHDIGQHAARQWGLPATVVNTMQDLPPRPVAEPLAHSDWLSAISTLSTSCATALCDETGSAQAALQSLAGQYADMLGMDASQVMLAVDSAQRNAAEENSVLVRSSRRTDDKAEPLPPSGKPADAVQILTRGVNDMRGAAPNATLSQLIGMALETVHQGLGFSRSIAFLRSREKHAYIARLSFGDVGADVMRRMSFSDAYQPDVFHAALANNKMIFVENARDPAFVNKVPRWWREALPTARSFMVLPVTVHRHPIGFIYGDWDASLPVAKVELADAGPLNELRSLVVRTFENRQQPDVDWNRGGL
ncbi:HDOD domain-containing protein [Noviherbaspirillum galbum]|uniref:HDOD domain-containing protein n=1 Tax=Noviherbaspirillum galbum TaxID=2709383 RepID=A0A6B3SKI0_9BURK|nr:HDOD domain-containing protein [Noviherbaspirillum galbum]NEX61311.1 HDOD domain-containing protein [Noviherbaspirillum galbum]